MKSGTRGVRAVRKRDTAVEAPARDLPTLSKDICVILRPISVKAAISEETGEGGLAIGEAARRWARIASVLAADAANRASEASCAA